MGNTDQTHTNDAYGLREEAKEFPMMLVLSFIYVCNAKCPNCPYNNSSIRDKYKDAVLMSEEIFKKIADESGPYGAYLRISGGGEPMLHPQAEELMLYAKKKRMQNRIDYERLPVHREKPDGFDFSGH